MPNDNFGFHREAHTDTPQHMKTYTYISKLMSSIPGNECPLLRNPRTSSNYLEVVICNGPLCFARQRKKERNRIIFGVFKEFRQGTKTT